MTRIALLLLLHAPLVQAQSYKSAVRGTIRDSATGLPLPGIYVWPFEWSGGATTDSAGHYELHGFYTGGQHTLILRFCTDSNLAVIHLDFRTTVVLERDTVISMPVKTCPHPLRAPWAVDKTDTTTFRGHYIYSWEGGGWLESCDHHNYAMAWTSDGRWGATPWQALRAYQRKEGQEAFLVARGRVSDQNVGASHGPLFLVQRIVELRSPKAKDCS